MRISHAAERTRRALWVMYTRLTSTRLHKFYTLTLFITLLSLIILHLAAVSNTTTALNKLSVILATANSTNDNSVVPTVTDQDGQGILRLCNVGQVDCQTVTSVAPTATVVVTSTSTPTLQQVASPINTVPVNAGAPTSSAIPVPGAAVQPEGARPASPAPISSQSGSSPPPPASPSSASPAQGSPATSDGGVLIAAPPAQTQITSSSSSPSTGVFIADAPSTTSTAATSTASTSEKHGGANGGGDDNNGGNGKGDGKGQGNGNAQEAPTETSATTGTNSTSSESSISAPTSSTTSATSSQESSTSTDSSTRTSTSSTRTEPPSSTVTSPLPKETDSHSKETENTSAPAVGKDVPVNDVTLSSSTTRALPSLVRPEFESSTVLPSSVLSTTVASTSSTSSPTASTSSSSSSSSSVDGAKDATDIDKQESASNSRTKESSIPTPTPTPTTTPSTTSTSKSESESTESPKVPGEATSTNIKSEIPRRSPSNPNTHFFSSRHLSPRAFSATPITNSTTGALDGIDVTDVDDTGGTEVTRLGVVCAIAMAFPRDQLRQEWMENLTMTAFYLSMLGVGIAAILNESVAQLITISLSTLLSLLWNGTQLVRTNYMHDQFDAFITRGACSGIDVLPSYWAQRTRLELPILIINALAFLLLGVLGVQLLKRYHREGGGRGVERYVYKVVVVLRCAILLGGFLLAAGMGIWVHLLFTNAGVVGANGVGLLKTLGIVSLVFALPWGVLGWLALNAATPSTSGAYSGGITSQNGKWGRWWGKRTMMGFFCGLNVLFLGGWIVTFASDVYRAVFLAWTFFAVLSIAGFFVLMGSLGAGVVCWMRFARNLQDFDSEKPPSDIMSRPFSIASIDPFAVRPSNHSHSHSGHSHPHVHGGGPESLRWDYSNTAEKAWEPFDKASIRQSQFTASEGRQSTLFSYGLRSPAPPMPTRPEYGSSNNSNVTLGLAL